MITIPVITERCAGIDVGKRGLAAAVAVGPADKEAEIKTRWFATTMPALCGVPGFRIRTAPKKHSVEKDPPEPPTGAAASGTPSPPKGGRARKTKT